jgi:cell pole-organizing protein PopZ
MEEILASIRRIIADDQESAAKAPEPAFHKPAPAPKPAPEPVALPEVDEEDVLDLATLPAPALRPAPEPAPKPAPEPVADDLSFRDQDRTPIDFDTLDIGEEEAVEEPEPLPAPPPPRPPQARPAPALEDRLLSTATDAAVGQAFNMLAHTVLTGNARTLEDLVREMLRPMLKNWLDDNLPSLVERLVRAEIERVARGGR